MSSNGVAVVTLGPTRYKRAEGRLMFIPPWPMPWKPVVGLGVACCRPSTPISSAATRDSRLRTWRSGVEQVGANILLTSSVDGLPSVPTAVADLHMLGLLHEAH